VKGSVRVVGSVPEGSEAVLVDREPAPDVKEVFLYAEFQNDPTAWLDGYKAGYNQVPAVPEGANGEGVLTLEAEETGYFRIFGEMSTEPFWEKTDTFDVSLAFSFTVIGEEEPQERETKDETIPDHPISAPEDPAPGDTENPEQPDTPAESETPAAPTEPTEPTEPEEPETPDSLDPSDPPVTPEQPDLAVPEAPVEPETPQEPEQPEESPDPVTPSDGKPVETEPTKNSDGQEPPVTPEPA